MGGFRSLGIRPIISRVITEPTAPTRRRIKKRHLIEFIKFGVVGGSGFLVNIIVAIIMNKANGGTEHAQDILFNLAGTRWNFRFTSLVWLVGFVVANITNFQLNRSWTFKREYRRGWWREFWPFFAVGSIAAIIGMFIKIFFTNPTSPIYLPEPWFNEGRGIQSREYWSQIFAIAMMKTTIRDRPFRQGTHMQITRDARLPNAIRLHRRHHNFREQLQRQP